VINTEYANALIEIRAAQAQNQMIRIT
jgi:hypothetical protein